MKFRVGDKVEVIDDSIKGVVKALDKSSVVVLTEDGFELSLDPGELVKIREDLKVSNIEVYRAVKEKNKYSKRPAPAVKREKTMPPMEVDLHIHKLTDSTRGMGNYDMLNLQMDTAKRQLEFAISKRIQTVVFIHGVGEGVLKKELEFLFNRYDNLSYYDADYSKYGLGATEVYIHQNVSRI